MIITDRPPPYTVFPKPTTQVSEVTPICDGSIDLIFHGMCTLRFHANSTAPRATYNIATQAMHNRPRLEDHPIYGKNYQRALFIALKTPETPVAVKWARGTAAIKQLRHEASLYERQMKHLQGEVVPRCYGMYCNVFDGIEAACLLLEWCFAEIPRNIQDVNCEIMLAARKLHIAGINHSDLLGENKNRNIIHMPDQTVRIVGFSKASRHDCMGSAPPSLKKMQGENLQRCDELFQMELEYGRKTSDFQRLYGHS